MEIRALVEMISKRLLNRNGEEQYPPGHYLKGKLYDIYKSQKIVVSIKGRLLSQTLVKENYNATYFVDSHPHYHMVTFS